jgi:uncharacterized Fe-S cluster-containing radical SAM superfamily protein
MNAVKQAIQVARIVSKGNKRKYYRFRRAPYYGGIATADCVGCCLTCVFCWSWNIVKNPDRIGKFYSPEYVAQRLVQIARMKNYDQIRISGNEPTLNREHLLEVLKAIPSSYRFILETNGILLGNDRSFCRDLAEFPAIHVRVSLKGCSAQEFIRLTGCEEDGFDLQLKALENLLAEGVSCHPAVMNAFSTSSSMEKLVKRLTAIHPEFRFPESEELLLYPPVEERLRRHGLIVS